MIPQNGYTDQVRTDFDFDRGSLIKLLCVASLTLCLIESSVAGALGQNSRIELTSSFVSCMSALSVLLSSI